MTVPYDLLRGLHILAVIAWMAGLLMLPRLYAYQTESEPGGELDRKMIEGAGRLRKIILAPAMLVAWALGLWLLLQYGQALLTAPWMMIKLALVIALSGYHGYLAAEGRRLAAGERRRSARFWRLTNELPFVAAIVIVLMATLEPRLLMR